MLPKLYDEFLTTSEGYGRTFLGTINHCTKCMVKEVRNGAYTLSLETTANDDCADLISTYISTTTPFTFTSDISTYRNFSLGLNIAESLGNILGGKEGSFVDLWGGEFHWDNYKIEFLASRGQQRDYQIRYGSNISDTKQTESCENTYTHILPYGKVSNGTHKINFFAPLYAIPNSQSLYTKVYMLDCTDLLDNYVVGDQGLNYDTCRTAMRSYAQNYASNHGLGKLSVSISVTLRAELDEMAQIGLCDTVKVVLDNFGTEATAKITETTYDSLLERWDKLVVGATRVTVADMILNRKRYVK